MPSPRFQVWTTATLLSFIIWLGLIWNQRLPYHHQYQHQHQHVQSAVHAPTTPVPRPPPSKVGSVAVRPGQHTAEQIDFVERLTRYGIHDVEPNATVSYNQILLNVNVHQKLQLPLVQDVKMALPELRHITTTNRFEMSIPPAGEASVDAVQSSAKVDASNLLFGLATTTDALRDSIEAISHWGSGNGARIIALIEEGTTQTAFDEVMAKAMSFGVQLKMERSKLCPHGRHFELVKTLHDSLNPETTWVSFIHDDTFFPSIQNLQAMLAKYDTKTEKYVGSYSEDAARTASLDTVVYGGAGVFVSIPLLKRIQPHYKSCMATDQPGDRRLANCILTHTTIRMSNEPLLRQVDLLHHHGDHTSSQAEALTSSHHLPVSLHDWKAWPRFSITNAALISQICGDDCIFQRYRFTDGWQLTNGISLTKTIDSDGNNKNKDKTGNKSQFLMENAMYDDRGKTVKQYYVRREKNQTRNTVDILVVLWRQ